MNKQLTLTSIQAFECIKKFLELYYVKKLPKDIQELILNMKIEEKDPHSEQWINWMTVTKRNPHMETLQAYKAMQLFLELYYNKTGSDNVGALLGGLQLHPDGETWDPAAWDIWVESVDIISELHKA